MQTALTIAGSDSGGGAGIQADLKTFAAHGVFGTSAVTAITVQNTRGVRRVHVLPGDLVAQQIEAVLDDFDVSAVKIGMLASAEIVSAVAGVLRVRRPPHVVLDTVLAATSGEPLINSAGFAIVREKLVPLVSVVTANLAEAAALTGLRLANVADAQRAAERLIASGAKAVVVKGGHLEGPPVDILHDGHRITEFSGDRLITRHTHGTGCTFSAALAARLALGSNLVAAVGLAKDYVRRAIAAAPGLGQGHGPLGHPLRADE